MRQALPRGSCGCRCDTARARTALVMERSHRKQPFPGLFPAVTSTASSCWSQQTWTKLRKAAGIRCTR